MSNYWLGNEKQNKWILTIPTLDLSLEVETTGPQANVVRNHLVGTVNYYEWLPLALKFHADHTEGMINFKEWTWKSIYNQAQKCKIKLEYQDFEKGKTDSWFMEDVRAQSISTTFDGRPNKIELKFDSVIHGTMKHKTNAYANIIED